MFCIRAIKPGSVCATQANPFSGLARAAGGLPLSNALPGLIAYLECVMVALAVYRLGYVPKPCLAKPMLFAALSCIDAGDLIGAGVRLRESVARFVIAACDWYGVPVKNGKHPRPGDYARALREAKHLDKWGLEIVLECLDAGNKLSALPKR